MEATRINNNFWGALRQRVLGITPGETSFKQRGFRGGTPEARERLEQVGAAFALGYNGALGNSQPASLTPELKKCPLPYTGFAYEGAAMGLALLDWFTPWQRYRIHDFLGGAGKDHIYMVHVGAGWTMARVPGSVERFLARFDPLLRWLLVDGYGFHEAFFHFPRYLASHVIPRRLSGYARRVFDQGFGRCLWFVEGTEIGRIQSTIATFPQSRQGDLWSGVGLASVYAGEISQPDLRALRQATGDYYPQLAQGAAFAAKARLRAGNPTPYTDIACHVLCGISAEQAAQITDLALENLPSHGPEPAYEIWRRRIQNKFLQPAKFSLTESPSHG